MGVPLTERDTEITRRRPDPVLDPMEAWRAFKPNTLMWARMWLETGELPPTCHFVIVEKLSPWIAAVSAGGPEMRDALLAVVPPIPTREPEPTRTWIMPAVGKTYSMEREIDEPERVEEQPASDPAEAPEKACGAAPGGVTHELVQSDSPPQALRIKRAVLFRFRCLKARERAQYAGGRSSRIARRQLSVPADAAKRLTANVRALWRRPQNDRDLDEGRPRFLPDVKRFRRQGSLLVILDLLAGSDLASRVPSLQRLRRCRGGQFVGGLLGLVLGRSPRRAPGVGKRPGYRNRGAALPNRCAPLRKLLLRKLSSALTAAGRSVVSDETRGDSRPLSC